MCAATLFSGRFFLKNCSCRHVSYISNYSALLHTFASQVTKCSTGRSNVACFFQKLIFLYSLLCTSHCLKDVLTVPLGYCVNVPEQEQEQLLC
jgi:hypothetical protein